jgi:hypothetical protein
MSGTAPAKYFLNIKHILNSILISILRSLCLLQPVRFIQKIEIIILIIKQTVCTNFSNLFWNETPHVSDSFSVHHQELFTVHSMMVYVIHV